MSSKLKLPNKHARELVKEAKKIGWHLEWNGSDHPRFAREGCRPIYVASTPKDGDVAKAVSLRKMKREMKLRGFA